MRVVEIWVLKGSGLLVERTQFYRGTRRRFGPYHPSDLTRFLSFSFKPLFFIGSISLRMRNLYCSLAPFLILFNPVCADRRFRFC